MPAATAATFTGIHNENEFYSHHYLSEIFSGDIRATVDRWRDAADAKGVRTPYAALRALAADYVRFRRDFDRDRRSERRLTLQREWFRQLLPALGYEWNPANHPLDDGDEVPVLCAAGGKAGAPALIALGAYDAEAEGEDPLALKPHRLQFHGKAPPPEALLRETWNDVVTRRLFGQDHPPRWLLVLSFSRVLLIERGKWTHNRLLRFTANNPALFALADALGPLKVPRSAVRILSIGTGQFPERRRLLSSFTAIRTIMTLLGTSSNTVDVLRDLLFRDVYMLRINEAFTDIQTDFVESNVARLKKVFQLGRRSFEEYEADLRNFFSM